MSARSPCHKTFKTVFKATLLLTCSPCVHRSEEQPYVAPVQPSPISSAPRSSSRLNYSLLKYSPGQYSTMLRSSVLHTQETATSPTQTSSYVQTSPEDGESPTGSELSSTSSPRARTSPSQIYTPFMKLMEISAKMNIDWMEFSWNGSSRSLWNIKYCCLVTVYVTLRHM